MTLLSTLLISTGRTLSICLLFVSATLCLSADHATCVCACVALGRLYGASPQGQPKVKVYRSEG